jgi:ParB-like chromosome segregation protein Spo0J
VFHTCLEARQSADRRLIAGERRLKAAKTLEWEKITAHVVHNVKEALDFLKAERDENTRRKEFSPLEIADIGTEIENLISSRGSERGRGSPNRGERPSSGRGGM